MRPPLGSTLAYYFGIWQQETAASTILRFPACRTGIEPVHRRAQLGSPRGHRLRSAFCLIWTPQLRDELWSIRLRQSQLVWWIRVWVPLMTVRPRLVACPAFVSENCANSNMIMTSQCPDQNGRCMSPWSMTRHIFQHDSSFLLPCCGLRVHPEPVRVADGATKELIHWNH
jgi:hypothetical protein